MAVMLSRFPVTIPNADFMSDAAFLHGMVPTVLEMSAAWTAAGLYFYASGDDSTYGTLYDETGTAVTMTTDEQHRIILPTKYFSTHTSIKVCSGAPGAGVMQGADRILYFEVWK